MPDIMKFIRSPEDVSPAVKDRELDLGDWSREAAERTARESGLAMTDAHWKVVEFLRARYLEHGPAATGRELASAMDEAFAGEGGSAYLHRIFPEGPVAQGCRIAGLPVPPYTEDRSFGSVM